MKSMLILLVAMGLVACEGTNEGRQPPSGPTLAGENNGTPVDGEFPETDEVRPDHEPPPPAEEPPVEEPPVEEPPVEEPPVEEPPVEEPPVEEPPVEEPPVEEPPVEEPPVEEPPVEEPPVEEPPVEAPGLDVLVRLAGEVGAGLDGGPLAGVLALLDLEILNGHRPLCDVQCVGGADHARLIEVLLGGELRVLGEGEVRDGHFRIDVLERPLQATSLLVVELFQGEDLVGGRFLAAGLALDGEQVLAPIDPESTLEARVAVALTERGIETDLCLVARLIDGAIALAVRHEGDIEGLIEAIHTSQLVFAQVLGTAPGVLASGCRMTLTQWELLRQQPGDGLLTLQAHNALRALFEEAGFDADHQALAIGQSTAAFEAMIDLLVGAHSPLGRACDGRGQLENAIAAVAALGADFRGGQLQAALDALIVATLEARDGEAVAHAGGIFEGELHGLLDVVVEGSLVGRLGRPLVDLTLGRCLDASDAAQLELVVALRAAAEAGRPDVCADRIVTAFDRHHGGLLDLVVDLLAVVALDAGGRGLVAQVLGSAHLGLYDGAL